MKYSSGFFKPASLIGNSRQTSYQIKRNCSLMFTDTAKLKRRWKFIWRCGLVFTWWLFFQVIPLSLSLSAIYYFQSCTRGGSEWTFKSFSFLREWSNTGTGSLENWSLPQAWQHLRGVWSMPITICFNFWSDFKPCRCLWLSLSLGLATMPIFMLF